MTNFESIEAAVSQLSPQELARIRAWFEELDARVWDERIERDAQTGRLDRLARQALEDHWAGRTIELCHHLPK